MKLLVSAYACEPGKGSEPGVGWEWVQALLRRGYTVHVITRSNNRENIEKETTSRVPELSFHYYDLPGWALKLKRKPGGIYFYYLFWQVGAYRLAKKLHAREAFDRVHHTTFVSYRQPSFMGRLKIPFVFGPVGGGETMPAALCEGLSARSRRAENARNLGNALIRFDPLMHYTYASANMIACTTAETMARIPRIYRPKCIVQLAIGINPEEIADAPAPAPVSPRFLFVGRLLYWKGLHLAMAALAEVRRTVPTARLTIVGKGEDRTWLEQRALALGVAEALDWIPSLPHAEISRAYRESTALVFPSMHDSGGMVVLEGLAAGLPLICLDLGGPGTLATSSCALVVRSEGATVAIVVKQLAAAMIKIASQPATRAQMAVGAIERARQVTWDQAARMVCQSIEQFYPPSAL